MQIIIRNRLFIVLDGTNNEKACFKSFAMLTEYIMVTERMEASHAKRG